MDVRRLVLVVTVRLKARLRPEGDGVCSMQSSTAVQAERSLQRLCDISRWFVHVRRVLFSLFVLLSAAKTGYGRLGSKL